MKYCFLFLLLFSGQSRADGLDQITVYVNGKEVFVTTDFVSNPLKLDSLHVGDTLEFLAWTDWSILDKATLLFQTEDGKLIRELHQYPTRTYGARFRFIVDEQFLQQKTWFVLHYFEFNDPRQDFWHFAFTNFTDN
jgi:hypothetical protein